MLCLAFDCSALSMSVAILKGNQIMGEKNYYSAPKHSEGLVLEIKNLMEEIKINFADLDLIVATNGPGGYTGIRVALAVLKIFQIATKVPCLTVTSCEVLANKYAEKFSKIAVAISANLGEVYFSKFTLNKNHLQTIIPPIIIAEEGLESYIESDDFLCGSANKIFTNHQFKSNEDDFILAQDVGIYGQKMFLKNNCFTHEISPLYLREPKISQRKTG